MVCMEHRRVRVGQEYCLLTVAAIPNSSYGNKLFLPQPVFHYQGDVSLRQHISVKDCYFGTFAKSDSRERQQGEKRKMYDRSPRMESHSKMM